MRKLYHCGVAIGLMLFSIASQANTQSNNIEIMQLKREVRALRQEVEQLKNMVFEGGAASTERHQWGCYLDDITAGGVYGSGQTEAEAKGKTLSQCRRKGGTCFENLVKCSSDN